MPRPALTDEQRRQTRRSIRKAAAELYRDNGMKDISARTIAQKAGVSVGTLYSYFDNLTELMQSLWKEPVSIFIAALEGTLNEVEDPLEKLRRLLRAYVTFALDQRSVYRSAFLFVRPEAHEKPEKISLEEDRFFSLFREVLISAQQHGLVRAGDPAVLVQTLWAGLHGAIALPQNMDRLALDPPAVAVEPMIEALLEWIEVRPL